jgi:prepilin-type N-terminal cleavage/methylation domain-containing protein
MHRRSTHPRRGFTLIEVLAVVAVVSILAGMVFPVLAQAREVGRRTACSSNARQLSGAASM